MTPIRMSVCARQYSLIDHADAVNELFPAVRKKNMSLVIGSSLNAGFISGSPRYNYGKENFKIPAAAIEKREKPEGGRSLWRGSAYGCASILGSAGCRGRPRRRGAKPSADRRGLQFAASENPVRILGRA
jgi:hypothetical protein